MSIQFIRVFKYRFVIREEFGQRSVELLNLLYSTFIRRWFTLLYIFKSFEFVFGMNRCTPPSSPSSHQFVRSRGTGNTTVLAVAVCEWAAKGRCIIHGASFQSCDVRDTPAGTNTGVPGDSEPQPRYLETIPHLISLNSLAKR